MTQETIVRLKILSRTRTPEMITDALGLQCDKCWRSGDARKHTTIIEKNNGWILHSGLPKTAGLDAHIKGLLDILEPAKKTIRDLSMTETVELSVVVYSSALPALSFGCEIISRLAEFGASMDIDLYVT
jgi:hypothetical protein